MTLAEKNYITRTQSCGDIEMTEKKELTAGKGYVLIARN